MKINLHSNRTVSTEPLNIKVGEKSSLKNKGNYTLSYSINNISKTDATIRKNSKFIVPVIVSYQATDRPIHHTSE